MSEQEQVVFVDEQGNPTGETGPKLASHHAHTKFHLGFSCYVFNDEGKLLVTMRASSKKVWPGVWTNSFCGHPAPGESVESAVRRRAEFELGLELKDLRCVLPDYRYTTPPFKGIIENEFCPIYFAKAASDVRPNPEEIGGTKWLTWAEYQKDMQNNPDMYSYWSKDQLDRLTPLVSA